LVVHLISRGIESKAYFSPPIHLQKFYKEKFKFKEGSFPMAEKLSKTTLILPLFVGMKKKEILKVKHAIEEFYSKPR